MRKIYYVCIIEAFRHVLDCRNNRSKILFTQVKFVLYAKLGLSLLVPGGGVKKKAAAPPQATPKGHAAPAAEDEEDEYAGGLC